MKFNFDDIKAVFINIISTALFEFIQLIAYLIFISSVFWFTNISNIIVSIFFVLGLLYLISFVYRNKRAEFKYIYKSKHIYFDYTEKQSIYNVHDEIVSLVKGLDRVNGCFTWDPNKADIDCICPQNSSIFWLPKNDAFYRYEQYFGGTKYNIGNKFVAERNSILNGDVDFSGFASTIIRPTNYMEIHIKLPLELLRSRFIRLVTIATPTEVGISRTVDAELNALGEYVWKIKKPKFSFKYCIEWDFNDDKLAVFEPAKTHKNLSAKSK